MTKKVLFAANLESFYIKFLIPQLKYFKVQGYEVTIAAKLEGLEIPYCDKKINIDFARSLNVKQNIKSYKQLKKVFQEEHYDIVSCHTPFGGAITRLAYKNCKVKNTKMIYMAHGFHFYKGAPLLNWVLFYPVEKYLAKYTDRLVTINLEDYTLAKRKFKTDVFYIEGIGVDDDRIQIHVSENDKENLKKECNIDPQDFVIVYVAELNKNKNQKMLIRAVQELNDEHIKVLLVGSGEAEIELKQFVEQNEVTNQIQFLGFRKDVPKILSIAHVGISTSIREGLGLNVIEYLLCGLPVIATKNRGHSSIIQNGKNGYLVEIHDVNALKERIQFIKENYDQQVQLIQKNSDIVKKYLLSNVMKKIEEIYR